MQTITAGSSEEHVWSYWAQQRPHQALPEPPCLRPRARCCHRCAVLCSEGLLVHAAGRAFTLPLWRWLCLHSGRAVCRRQSAAPGNTRPSHTRLARPAPQCHRHLCHHDINAHHRARSSCRKRATVQQLAGCAHPAAGAVRRAMALTRSTSPLARGAALTAGPGRWGSVCAACACAPAAMPALSRGLPLARASWPAAAPAGRRSICFAADVAHRQD